MAPIMSPYEAFREELRDALNHLHDPDYHASPALAEAILGDRAVSVSSVQYAIIQAIQHLSPPPDTPESAPLQRSYDLLVHRFLERLTQEETAEQLHTTVRNIRREQRVATHMLARFLWEHRGHSAMGPADETPTPDRTPEPDASPSRQWRSQARRELAALRQSNPSVVADVGSVVRRAVDLERALAESYGVTLTVGQIADDITAAVHPTALRQVLIMAIGQLSRSSRPCEIHLDAWEETGTAAVQLRGITCASSPADAQVTAEMLELLGGSLTITVEDSSVNVVLRVPAVGKINVVVVDDNQDFVHFCRRCVRGTRFRILQPKDWTSAAIQEAAPDVILLDIMLSDVDGWELLQALQREPSTALIPVVVCSIVREEALAAAMGAIEYLPKPIQHQDLLATLERVTG